MGEREDYQADDTLDLEVPSAPPPDASGDFGSLNEPSFIGEIPWHEARRGPMVIALAGGKGGAGRSLLAANVGLFLASLGREVIVADLDPAGANLHTYLGVEPLLLSFGALLRGGTRPQLERISGMSLWLCRAPRPLTASPVDPLREETLEMALNSEADIVILDMGAQHDDLTLDQFLSADLGVLVTLPDSAAVERAYAFLRTALYRRILHGSDEPAVIARALLNADHVNQLETPTALIEALSGVHPNAASAIRARLMAFTPKILMNRCRARADRELEAGMISALRRLWGINAEGLGGGDHDDIAHESTRKRRPVMLAYPGSTLGGEVERLSRRLLALLNAGVERA
ncbi:P-loop NTPase [Myxococcota bacterium]|nr:P-loop NTPase [Myxococcota bacterium]